MLTICKKRYGVGLIVDMTPPQGGGEFYPVSQTKTADQKKDLYRQE